MTPVVVKIMVPKEVYTLLVRNYKYITLHGKKDFTDVIRTRIRITIL
jgi:hypothetical protein